jgi:hypothetical protein
MFPLILPLFACSMEDPNLEELRRLCEKDAGVNIYRTVDADGYYDGEKKDGSLEVLFHSDFDFIEFCDDAPVYGSMLKEPGCGRYTRVRADSGRCNKELQHILENSFGEPYASFRKDFCVEFELIEIPTARYVYEGSLKSWLAEDDTARFMRSRAWITDIYNSEIIGEFTTYILDPRPGAMIWKSCDNIDGSYPTFTDADLVNTVLARSKNQHIAEKELRYD